MSLPREVFASGHEEEEGILNLAAPISGIQHLIIFLTQTGNNTLQSVTAGPQPDWDPEIVAALDDAIDLNDPENILDDDFILQVCYFGIYVSLKLFSLLLTSLFSDIKGHKIKFILSLSHVFF